MTTPKKPLNKRVRLLVKNKLGKYRVVWGWRRILYYPSHTHYSEHFTRTEMNCKGAECAGKQPPAAVQKNLTLLAADLEVLRATLGRPIQLMSAYRCPVHNKRVHGASQSQHIQGTAADLAVRDGEQRSYVVAAEKVPAFRHGGIGVYEHGGVHVDRRGWVARWNDWIRT